MAHRGELGPLKTEAPPLSLFADAKLSTRCFLWLRSSFTSYRLIASTLPSQGRLLDLGSGHGLLSFTLALGGILVMQEIDAGAGIKAAVNRLYEWLATGIGFTRSAERQLSFRAAREWTGLLETAGFSVHSLPSGPRLLADLLFVARRNL